MQSEQPTVPQTSASELYMRAIGCLMGNADPLSGMTVDDKYRVLGMIVTLRAAVIVGACETRTAAWTEALDEVFARRKENLDEVFARRKENRDGFVAALKEHGDASLEAVGDFFDALQVEVGHMWKERLRRAQTGGIDGPGGGEVPPPAPTSFKGHGSK